MLCRYNFSDEFIPFYPTWYGWIPKMVVDQTIYAFTWNVLYMFLIGTTKGQKMDEVMNTVSSGKERKKKKGKDGHGDDEHELAFVPPIFEQIRTMWWPLQREGWKLWPMIHIITYNFIPREERVFWVDLVELVWVMLFITILKKEDAFDLATDSKAAAEAAEAAEAETVAAAAAAASGGSKEQQ